MLQEIFSPVKERNVYTYNLVNSKGDRICVERGRTYLWVDLYGHNGSKINTGFTIDDFEGDSVQFNRCINETLDDMFDDGFYLMN